MSVHNRTTRDAINPRKANNVIATVRPGAEKVSDKKPGKNQDRFRITWKDPALATVFAEIYGSEPKVIPGIRFMPYLTPETACETFMEVYTGNNALRTRCDGLHQIKHLTDNGHSHDPIPCAANGDLDNCPLKCKLRGRLYFILPEFMDELGRQSRSFVERAGIATFMFKFGGDTTSSQLLATLYGVYDSLGTLSGVNYTLMKTEHHRTDMRDGKPVRYPYYAVELHASLPDLQDAYQERLASPEAYNVLPSGDDDETDQTPAPAQLPAQTQEPSSVHDSEDAHWTEDPETVAAVQAAAKNMGLTMADLMGAIATAEGRSIKGFGDITVDKAAVWAAMQAKAKEKQAPARDKEKAVTLMLNVWSVSVVQRGKKVAYEYQGVTSGDEKEYTITAYHSRDVLANALDPAISDDDRWKTAGFSATFDPELEVVFDYVPDATYQEVKEIVTYWDDGLIREDDSNIKS